MRTLTLPFSYLAASILIAPKNDDRAYLNAVYLDIGRDDVRVVATDGARMTVLRVSRAEGSDAPPCGILIPREVIAGAKVAKGRADVSIAYDETAPLSECRLSGLATGDRVFRPLDFRYPDYWRVIPGACSGEPAEFNWQYIADFDAFLRVAFCTKDARAELHRNGNSAAAVTWAGSNDFLGVIMPMRVAIREYRPPAWAVSADDHEAAKKAIAEAAE